MNRRTRPEFAAHAACRCGHRRHDHPNGRKCRGGAFTGERCTCAKFEFVDRRYRPPLTFRGQAAP